MANKIKLAAIDKTVCKTKTLEHTHKERHLNDTSKFQFAFCITVVAAAAALVHY